MSSADWHSLRLTRQLERQFYKTQPSVSTIPRFPIIGFLEILKYKDTHKQWKLKEIILQNKMCLVTVCFHTLHIVRLNKYGHARQCPGYTIPISYVICLKCYTNIRQDDRFVAPDSIWSSSLRYEWPEAFLLKMAVLIIEIYLVH